VLTDQTDPDIQVLERRQRQRAHAKDAYPQRQGHRPAQPAIRDFEHNRVWLLLVGIAHDVLAWTSACC
jgi:hypothetical protein